MEWLIRKSLFQETKSEIFNETDLSELSYLSKDVQEMSDIFFCKGKLPPKLQPNLQAQAPQEAVSVNVQTLMAIGSPQKYLMCYKKERIDYK